MLLTDAVDDVDFARGHIPKHCNRSLRREDGSFETEKPVAADAAAAAEDGGGSSVRGSANRLSSLEPLNLLQL